MKQQGNIQTIKFDWLYFSREILYFNYQYADNQSEKHYVCLCNNKLKLSVANYIVIMQMYYGPAYGIRIYNYKQLFFIYRAASYWPCTFLHPLFSKCITTLLKHNKQMPVIWMGSKLWKLSACSVIAFLKYVPSSVYFRLKIVWQVGCTWRLMKCYLPSKTVLCTPCLSCFIFHHTLVCELAGAYVDPGIFSSNSPSVHLLVCQITHFLMDFISYISTKPVTYVNTSPYEELVKTMFMNFESMILDTTKVLFV